MAETGGGLGGGDPGPDLTEIWESSATAITLQEAGGDSVVIAGPNHSSNLVSVSTEFYGWTPNNLTEIQTWYDGLGSGEVTITLDEGLPPTELDAQSLEASATLSSPALTVEDPDPVDLDAQSLEAEATISSPTLQVGTPVDPVVLTAQSLEAEATLSSPELQVTPPLQLSDFDTTGLETEALALIQAASQVDVFSRPPRTARGELLEGELEISDSDEPITRLRITGSGAKLGHQ